MSRVLPLTVTTEQKTRQRGNLAELQHLWRFDRSNLVSGGGVYRADDEMTVRTR